MFPPLELGQNLADFQDSRSAKESEVYLLKPMNCPFHMEIYNDELHSYRDLPLKFFEFGTVYRYEQRGELGGLNRVRGFTQDDAHIICTPEQIETEMEKILDFAMFVLNETFGFEIQIMASFRDQEKDKYLGSDANWNMAENAIRKVLQKRKIKYQEETGEAAFYGPKMDFKVCDAIGRMWQLSTIQFDFNLPARFKMTYIDSSGKEKQPFVIHRALLGSLERFMGILIEHTMGAFPAWLCPTQAYILPINKAHENFAQKLSHNLNSAGARTSVLPSSESLGKRIRTSQTQKIPFSILIGEAETKSGKLTVRKYGESKDKEMSKEEFIKNLGNK